MAIASTQKRPSIERPLGEGSSSVPDHTLLMEKWTLDSLAVSLGLVDEGCSMRGGDGCNCGVDCACKLCDIHNPESASETRRKVELMLRGCAMAWGGECSCGDDCTCPDCYKHSNAPRSRDLAASDGSVETAPDEIRNGLGDLLSLEVTDASS